MQGFQFAHMEVFSARGSPGAGPEVTAKRKNGQRAWTAEEVIDELERLELASQHVIPGRPGPEILPGTVASFDGLREAQCKAASVKESFAYTKKDGTKQTRKRRLRADAASLYTAVVSLPVRAEDALRDEAVRGECMTVLTAALEHERQRIVAAGGEVAMGVVHWDEEHVHIHIIGLDPKRGRVDHLHPGRTAKKAFHEAHKDGEDRKAVAKAGNKAYCDAMRGWQDGYYEGVFDLAGLMRYGPRRARMSTSEYRRHAAAKAALGRDEARAEAAHEKHARLAAETTAMEDDKARLAERERAVGAREKTAGEEITRGKAMTSSAEAMMEAIKTGCEAIETRAIDYREANDDKPEGLTYGPNKPPRKADRTALADRIRPAFDFLVEVARRALGAPGQERRPWTRRRRRRTPARRSSASATTSRRREPPSSAAGRPCCGPSRTRPDGPRPGPWSTWTRAAPCALDVASFPGAWAIAPGADQRAIREELDGLTNVALRDRWMATRDAVRLTEDDAALRTRFGLGVRVLEHGAGQRGFDLETGRHHPARATDPDRARLHTDSDHRPIRVVRTVRDHQLTRG